MRQKQQRHIQITSFKVLGLISAEYRLEPRCPSRKTTAGSFCIDIRTRPGKEIDAGFTSGIKERLKVKDAITSVCTGRSLDEGPVIVE